MDAQETRSEETSGGGQEMIWIGLTIFVVANAFALSAFVVGNR